MNINANMNKTSHKTGGKDAVRMFLTELDGGCRNAATKNPFDVGNKKSKTFTFQGSRVA